MSGTWKLGAGRAITLRPREDGVLRVAHGGLWVTFDGPFAGAGNESGDHFLHAGEQITVQAGQRLVAESSASCREAPAYFNWEPMPLKVREPLRAAGRWQMAVVQPLADLRLALVLGLGAVGRLAGGLVGVAGDLVAGRDRTVLEACAFNAQAKACRAHGAMS
ncbi:MAG: DUF2917 domain-containing protein [Ramlibacter sp.]